ncbi:MAG TPA: SDR family oxidoreductase, partial [Candidatus Thermoplasmatota archaeon]|nr:SDR family oxidoreductase [Candidatus Thermoplasmatota archaeon]
EVERAMDGVEAELGPLDALVNNAGENKVQPFLEISDADLARMLDVNFKSAFLCTQAAGRRMVARKRGSIVNVSSMAGCFARPGSVAYGAAKAAVNSLTMSAAEALAPHVNVNAVAPGFVDTELNAYVPAERRRAIEEQTPAKRWATPDEICETVAFFALGPRFVTGQILRADGGIGNIYFRS